MNDFNKIMELLYKTKGSCGVVRQGYYNVGEKNFHEAAKIYIKTGRNHLTDLDILVRAGGYERRTYRRQLLRHHLTKEEGGVLRDFIAGVGFWSGKYISETGVASMKQYLADGVE